jgi:Tol biopolymer transport system component
METRTRHLSVSLVIGVAALFVLMVAPSCQPAQPPRSRTVVQREYPTPTRSLNLSGQVVFAPGDGSLWLQNANGGNARVLVKSTGESYAANPAFSPDGKQVAYAMETYTQNGEMLQDIRVVGLDGKNERVIAAPSDPKTAFNFPTWSLDGKEIWFTRSSTLADAPYDEVDRVSSTGGVPSKVIEDGRAATISRDGQVAFLRLDFQTYRSSLWLADMDGRHATQILDANVFASLQGARFSPDSQSIVLAASGAPQKPLPGLQGSRGGSAGYAHTLTASSDSCLVRFLFTCWLDAASAHGLPWDLWTVNLAGTRWTRLTEIGADSPYPAWSADGKFVAFMDLSGIYVVNRETKEGYLVSMNGGHGALDWR